MARTRVSPVRYLQVTGGQSNEYASAIYLAAGSGVTLSPTVSGDVATITIAASGGGGGGTSDHTQLSNLGWASSGHTGTANRIAAFNAQGAASFLQVGVDVQAHSATLVSVSAGTWPGASSITTLGTVGTGTWQASAVGVSYGGTGATTASGARTNLGLVIGTDVQAQSAVLASLAGANASANSVAFLNPASAGAVAPPSTPRAEYVLGWLNDSTLGWVARFSVLAAVTLDYLGSDIPGPGAGQTLS